MKQFKILFFSALLGYVQILAAQSPSFLWSPVMEFKFKKEAIDKVMSYDGNSLFLLRSGGELPTWYQMEKYDANLKPVYQTALKPTVKGPRDNNGYISSLVCNGKPIAFFYHWDDAASVYNVIARRIDDKGEMGEEVIIGKDKAEKFGKAPDYKFVASADGSKFAAIGVMPFEKESIETWHVLIYESEGLKEIQDKIMECLVPRERFEINDMMLSNTGSLQVFKMWDVKKEGKFSSIVTVTPDGKVKRSDLDLEGKAISFHKVFVNNSGHASVIGFLNPDEKDWKRISGHFYMSVDAQGNFTNKKIENLGSMVLGHVYSGLSKEKAEKEGQPLKEFEFVDFIENENGEMTAFIEHYSQLTKSGSTDPTSLISIYDRTHKQAIAIRFDKTGTKLWAQKFDKKQNYLTKQSDKYWGGFVPFISENNIYYIWNHIQFPEIPGKLAQATQGWYDAAKEKHFVYEEYGNRAHFPTCMSGTDDKGEPMFADQPVKFALPLIGMYKNAVYSVTFNSRVFARYKNSLVLIMEMPAGIAEGATKYHLCKLSL